MIGLTARQVTIPAHVWKEADRYFAQVRGILGPANPAEQAAETAAAPTPTAASESVPAPQSASPAADSPAPEPHAPASGNPSATPPPAAEPLPE
jgi:hypothetical protein